MSLVEDPPRTAPSPWSLEESRELYRIDAWGNGYFGINQAGHVTVRPRRDEGAEVDMMEIVSGLEARGVGSPFLLRFPDILDDRLQQIHRAFHDAVRDNSYQGRYLAVYPIKVNQQRHVVEEIFRHGEKLGFGLEVGSKPELLAALGISRGAGERPIICNGFKDDEYIESAILARKLGRNVIPVVEGWSELPLIVKHAERYGVEPRLGVRVKLTASGAGRWSHSAGALSKFGLTVSEVLDALRYLQERGLESSLKLLHCHLGSQIHDIKNIKDGINELTHVYVELHRLGAGLEYLDVGGGLGVDYDGSQSNYESSMNYTLEEYASDIVYRVSNVCDNEEVPHPTIVTECGRAMVAHHSVLVFHAFGASTREQPAIPDDLELDDEAPQPVFDLLEAYRSVGPDTVLEAYHDAVHAHDDAMYLFNLGYLSLPLRGLTERLFWATCIKVRDICRGLEDPPEELDSLEDDLRDTYFGNFSLFQSVPDSWALRQIFPVAPLHRLGEKPTRRAVLADVTCDSDGKIDLFQDLREIKKTLEVHPLREGESYYLGVFLVGAYQETLGDLHNLFGDTHVAQVRVGRDGKWSLDALVEGDTVREVLGYFQYQPDQLFDQVRQDCEEAVAAGRMSLHDSRALLSFYRSGLDGYTYLEGEGE